MLVARTVLRKASVVTRLLAARRTLAALAAAPLLVTGLVACGGDDSEPEADASASDTSQAVAESDADAGDSVEPADFADRLADGFANITTAHTTMKGDFGTSSMSGEGDVDYSGDTPAVAMTMSSEVFGADDAEVRLVDGVMYLDIGGLTQGKFWKLDLDDPDSPFGALGSQLDPKSSVEVLEKGLKSVTYVGAEDSLDHYTATVDPQALVDHMGGAMGSEAAPSLPDSFEYDVWLDDENRVNKLTTTMGDVGSVEMTLSDFGAEVDIEAPPADDITEMPGMFSSPSSDPQA